MKTLTIKITDAVIKKALVDNDISQLKDPRYSLYFRINSNRTGGSWILRRKNQSKTVGRYPQVNTKAVMAVLSELQLAVFCQEVTPLSTFATVGDVLSWHLERCQQSSSLSKVRKINIKYMVTRHLLPHVEQLLVVNVDHATMDKILLWPLQSSLNIASVRAVFAVLKTAMKKAHRLGLISMDPVASMKFSDFITATLPIKTGAIRSEHLPNVIQTLQQHHNKMAVMLAMMMMAHGTRIGETRKAKWQDIDLNNKWWFIPAENTKTKQAHRLPLSDLMIVTLQQYQHHHHSAYLFSNGNRKALSACDASTMIRTISNRQWTAHDLRKLARTLWADLDVDYMVGELLLNHALSKLDQTYIHTYAEQQKRTAIDRYHHHLNQHGFFLALDNSNGTGAVLPSNTQSVAALVVTD